MRISGIAALGVGLALALLSTFANAHGGGGGGGGHGGGGGGGYVVVVGGGVALPLFRGDEASMALEVVDAPPTSADTDIRHGDVIGVTLLRSADAIVLLDKVKGRRRDLPAGTVLVRMIFASPIGHPTVWCDVRPTNRPLWPQEYDCLEDSKGDGHVDRLWQADTQGRFLGFSTTGVGYYNDPMPTPAAYRPARPEERPTAQLGYRYCDGDGVTGPPRFALVLAPVDNDGRWPLAGGCRFGVWPDIADKSKVQVDGLLLDVSPGAQGELHVKITNRIPPEALSPLGRAAPVRSLADTPSTTDVTATRAAMTQRGPLIPVGGAPSVTWGDVPIGGVFFTAQVQHAITGTLQNRINPSIMWHLDTPVEVGQPVFGLIGTGWGADGIVWCAPRQKGGVYDTVCFLPLGDSYLWIPHRQPALLPTTRAINELSQTGGVSTDPTVKRGPISMPAMTLSMALTDISPKSKDDPTLLYHIDIRIDWGEGPQVVAQPIYQLTPAGRIVWLVGQNMLLKPGPDPTKLLVEAPRARMPNMAGIPSPDGGGGYGE